MAARVYSDRFDQGMDSQDSVLSVGSIFKLRGKEGLKVMAETANLMKFCIENMLNPFLWCRFNLSTIFPFSLSRVPQIECCL